MGDPQLAPGSLYANRFEIIRTAGRGGMGTVYCATDRHHGDLVALKLLHVGGVGPGESERFAREAQLLSELQHPGIVSHIAHGQAADGQRFLAMEWLEGQDLAQRLSRTPLSVRDSLQLLGKVADALGAAHQRGIIHRDLKPSNLFLVGGDLTRVKILDFGIARRTTSGQALTRTGTVIGTPEYMAPEQARGERGLSPAADLFSLGCILYECLTGQPPFRADHVAAVLVRILFEEPTPIEECWPSCPAALSTLLGRLLAKDPAQRIPDATTLWTELTRLEDLPEPALAPTLVGRGAKLQAFAENEQFLLSVVVASPQPEDVAGGALPSEDATWFGPPGGQALPQALVALGCSPNCLADGTLVVTVPPLGSAQDQALLAARAAQLIHERWPQAMVSMATGRASSHGRTAVGEVVDLAVGLSQASGTHSASTGEPGVLLDGLSARLLEGRFAQTPLPGGTFLLGAEVQADVSRPLLGKPTPCVGRDAELGTLESLLASCIEDSHARAVLVTALPGAGKSRLRHEFLRRIERRSEPPTILLGRGDRLQAGAAYAIFANALLGLCGVLRGEELPARHQRLKERLEQHVAPGERASITPFVAGLCGVTLPEAEYPVLQEAQQSPKLFAKRLRQACLSWLAAECQARPVVFVLDDIHWSDELTIALIHDALRELRELPLLILALGRPELHQTFPSIWSEHKPQHIQLRGLSRRACERLIRDALTKQISSELIDWIIDQSQGNALFLEELIRAAADGQISKCPDSVLAMLQSRIGHLATGPRRFVLAAAVFGRTFGQAGVARLLAHPEQDPEIESWIRLLIQAEFIEENTANEDFNQKSYQFRHSLVREAAYNLISENDRRVGHQRAAQYFEQSAKPDAVVLAEHYRCGGKPQIAISWYIRAADSAYRLFALQSARQHCAVAHSLLPELPEDLESNRLRVDVLLRQVQFGILAESTDVQFTRLREAESWLGRVTALDQTNPADRRRWAWVDLLFSRAHYYRGQQPEAVESCRRVLPVAEALADEELLAFPSQLLGALLLAQGQAAKSRPLLTRAVALQDGLDTEYDRLRTLGYYAINQVICGECRDGMAMHQQALARAAESQQPAALSLAHTMRCSSLRLCGDYAQLLEAAQLAYELADKCSDKFCSYMSLSLLAIAHSFRGHVAQASEYRDRAKALTREISARMLSDWFAAGDAEMALRAGDPEQAVAIAEQLAPGFRKDGRLLALGLAEQVWGLALARRALERGSDETELAAATAHLAEGLAIMESTEQRMNAAILRLEWAQLERARGASDRAALLHAQALAQFATAGCLHLAAAIEQRAALSESSRRGT